MKNQRLRFDDVAILDIFNMISGLDRECGTQKGCFEVKVGNPKQVLFIRLSPCIAFLHPMEGGLTGITFLPFEEFFLYFQNSSHTVEPNFKHNFSMLVRKNGEDSMSWTFAKRTLNASATSFTGQNGGR